MFLNNMYIIHIYYHNIIVYVTVYYKSPKHVNDTKAPT